MEPSDDSSVPCSSPAKDSTCVDSTVTQALADNDPADCDQPVVNGLISTVTQALADNDPADCDQPVVNGLIREVCLNILDLPSEMILHICSFLHAKFVIKTLSQVSTLFHNLINDNTFWKIRLRKRFPKKYPVIPVNDDEFDWHEACMAREETQRLWSQRVDTMDYFHYTSGLFAPVDAVHLMKEGRFLATGSRDRYLHLLDLDKLESGNPGSANSARLHAEMAAHKGWIWSISSLDNTLLTGSWDSYVKFWDLEDTCTCINKIKLKSAVLCTHYEPGFVAVGSYDKQVNHIDPRSMRIVTSKVYHRRPVLCLAADDKYILTGSEDNTLKVYDRRGDAVLKTLTFDKYPMALSYGRDQLWVGDKSGSLHLLDPSDGDFNIIQTYDIGHTGKITGVRHTLGALYTGSTDKTVRISEPNHNPSVIATLDEQTAEVASIDLQNDILVQANSSVSVGIWKPKPVS